MVSIYKWHGYHRICTFKRFVTKEFQARLWREKHWFVGPQSDFVCDADGRLLMDFVGRFETLQADFDAVCGSIGLPPTPIPHVNDNTSGRNVAQTDVRRELRRGLSYPWWVVRGRSTSKSLRSYRDYYDEDSKGIVAELYKDDIDLFGFDFESGATKHVGSRFAMGRSVSRGHVEAKPAMAVSDLREPHLVR